VKGVKTEVGVTPKPKYQGCPGGFGSRDQAKADAASRRVCFILTLTSVCTQVKGRATKYQLTAYFYISKHPACPQYLIDTRA